jgi:RNA polymerase sigma-70 factor, ECF subfamily
MSTDEHTLPAFEAPRAVPVGPPAEPVASAEGTSRLRRIIDSHYDAVWRTVRFLGIPEANAEDAAQQVFCVAARKLEGIPEGAELRWLLGTAWRVASEFRRAARRRPVAAEGDVEALVSRLPSPDELIDEKRARAVLYTVLEAMPADLRIVFVLYEIEELTLPEIASATGIRLGTVTSRLRRAREEFQSIVKRRTAAEGRGRGGSK